MAMIDIRSSSHGFGIVNQVCASLKTVGAVVVSLLGRFADVRRGVEQATAISSRAETAKIREIGFPSRVMVFPGGGKEKGSGGLCLNPPMFGARSVAPAPLMQ
jgi:hypothetical protein